MLQSLVVGSEVVPDVVVCCCLASGTCSTCCSDCFHVHCCSHFCSRPVFVVSDDQPFVDSTDVVGCVVVA